MKQLPSPFQILKSDSLCVLPLVVIFFLWFYYLLDRLIPAAVPAGPNFLWIAASITVVGITVVVWRYFYIHALFEDGIEVIGTITTINIMGDRGRLDYLYTYQNQRYTGWVPFYSNKIISGLRPGEELFVIVDRNNPKRSIIRNFFLRK